jgi:hypothetical protein
VRWCMGGLPAQGGSVLGGPGDAPAVESWSSPLLAWMASCPTHIAPEIPWPDAPQVGLRALDRAARSSEAPCGPDGPRSRSKQDFVEAANG